MKAPINKAPPLEKLDPNIEDKKRNRCTQHLISHG